MDSLGEKEAANTHISKVVINQNAEALEPGAHEAQVESEARNEIDIPPKPTRIRLTLALTHSY